MTVVTYFCVMYVTHGNRRLYIKSHHRHFRRMMSDHESPQHEHELARPYEKYGQAAMAGWQPLPDVFLKNQADIGLSATEMLVAFNVLSHWWYKDELPFVRVSTIAKRMNVSKRTVQRALEKLIDLKLFERRREKRPSGTEVEAIDPSGLVRRLSLLAQYDPSYINRQRMRAKRAFEKQL